jgi:hypothetical protein
LARLLKEQKRLDAIGGLSEDPAADGLLPAGSAWRDPVT